MPASMATKLGIQFARFAQYTAASAATNNAGTHGLRGAFANTSSGPAFAPGFSSSGSASAHSTGIGGAKFQAGKGAHSSFQNSGRSLANANASSANDGNTSISDEDDDLAMLSTHGLAQIHRPFFQERRESIFQQGLRSRLLETTSTLHLILPSSSGRHVSGARSISTSTSQESPALASRPLSSTIEKEDAFIRPRSLSTSASQAQEVITTEAGLTSPLEEGLFGQAQSQPALLPPRGKEALEGNAAIALERLSEARQSGQTHLMQSALDIYRQSPRDHFSTAGFNSAIRIVIDLQEEELASKALEIYDQMINANCPPNRLTYAYLVRVLCHRDYSQLKADANEDQVSTLPDSDLDYKKALAFFEVVHSSPPGFSDIYPYNLILRSCALRGDAERACAVIDKISANKFVSPTALTFLELINAFRRSTLQGSSPDELQEGNARKIQSCEHVFVEFEVFRSSKGWIEDFSKEERVWNAMISMYFQLGSPERGIELVQKMMDGEPLSKGKQKPPRPSSTTSYVVIRDLIAAGDIEGGLDWLERIMTLNHEVKEGGKSMMPSPNSYTIETLFKAVVKMIPLRNEAITTDSSQLLEYMPLVVKANRILNLIYEILQASSPVTKSIDRVKISNGNWQSILSLNAKFGTELIKQGHLEQASILSDVSLSHIKQHFDVYAHHLSITSLSIKYPNLKASTLRGLQDSVRSILQVIRLLLQQNRFLDAAACFSYAISAWASPLSFNEVSEVSFAAMGFCRKIDEAHTDHKLDQYATLWQINPEADVKLHTQIALTYILPAVQQRMVMPYSYKLAAKDIYLAARKQVDAAELNLDLRGWGYLIESLISEGFRKEIDVGFLEVLVNDLASLSESDRDQLSLQVMIAHLPGLIGQQEALNYLQRIRPALIMNTTTSEAVIPVQEAESIIDSAADEQSQQTAIDLASPMTNETSLGSPETASEYNSSLSFVLPPIVTIDADLGHALIQESRFNNQRRVKGARNVKGSKEQQNATKLQPLYERLTKSVQEEGVYPTPDGICELMNQFGRIGHVERVKELYLIGRHVVAALGGDANWQMQAWYELEDTMTAALAHGGDHRLANAHRITLLEAGRAPRADTYAALITVIRDTTDDVMVAEELFEESQRLGVTPTLYLFNTVLSKLSRARKAERAMQLFDEMRNRGVQPSSITYGAVLNACTRTGDEVNAERFFSMMESDAQFRPQAPPYNTMLQFYTQTKPDRQKALFYYGKACRKNVEHTSHTYKLLLDMYGSIEPVDIKGMRSVFGKLIADYRVEVQGNHWAALIWSYGSHLKDLEKAIEVYRSIPTHVATVRAGKSGKEPDALAFEALLGVLAEHKRMDLIEEQIREREEKGCELTAYVANVVIKAFATLVPEVGLERARQVFEKMQDPPMGMAAAGNHPLQRQHVSGVQREDGYHINSSATDDHMPGFERLKREPSTFEAMIRAEMEHGNLEQATALIHRMQSRGYPPIVVAHAQDILVQQPTNSES